MTLPNRFSAAEFSALGIDTRESRILADELQEEVERSVRSAIDAAMRAIVDELNSMGHNLRRDESAGYDEIVYFDDEGGSTEWHKDLKLRLALDWTAAAGYRHLTPPSIVDQTEES